MLNLFVGVVEDRNDPEKMGRVRVRVYGDHTADKVRIPTDTLPWAQVIMPVTSASTGGIGQSATGIVQGSWVVGFYMDGESKQQPMIIGTVPGEAGPSGKPSQGFSDPDGIHPVRKEGPDTPYPAIAGFHDQHASYIQKRDLRQTQIEEAVPDRVVSVAQAEPDSYYERNSWDMPLVMSGRSPKYPFNKVIETEGGHVTELDDTPGNERISTFHKSGTNEEYQANGDHTFTVVGSNYTCILGSDHIYINGDMKMTIDGDLRQLVKGNYHLEVNGNKTELIRGSRQSSIELSEHIEIGQDFASNVTENYTQRAGGDETRIVDGSRNTTIGSTDDTTVSGDLSLISLGKVQIYGSSQYALTTNGTLNITASGNITVETPSNMTNNVEGNLTDNVTGNVDVNAARIDLN